MPDLTISIRPQVLSDRSRVYDVELRQADRVITLPCYDLNSANHLAARLAGSIEADACVDVELI